MSAPITPEALTALAEEWEAQAEALALQFEAEMRRPAPSALDISKSARILSACFTRSNAALELRTRFGLPVRAGATLINVEEP